MPTLRKLGDIAEKDLSKGSEIAAEGKIINRSYVDSEGVKRHVS